MKKMLSVILALLMLCTAFVLPSLALYDDVYDEFWGKAPVGYWEVQSVAKPLFENTYGINVFMSRAQVAEMLSAFLNLPKGDINLVKKFEDVDMNSIYAQPLADCVAAGVFKGRTETLMGFEDPISREEFITVMCRSVGIKPLPEGRVFPDSDLFADYAKGYANALSVIKHLEGYPDGYAKPKRIVSRTEAAKLLANIVCLNMNKMEAAYITKGGSYNIEDPKSVVVVVTTEPVVLSGDFVQVAVKPGANVTVAEGSEFSFLADPMDVVSAVLNGMTATENKTTGVITLAGQQITEEVVTTPEVPQSTGGGGGGGGGSTKLYATVTITGRGTDSADKNTTRVFPITGKQKVNKTDKIIDLFIKNLTVSTVNPADPTWSSNVDVVDEAYDGTGFMTYFIAPCVKAYLTSGGADGWTNNLPSGFLDEVEDIDNSGLENAFFYNKTVGDIGKGSYSMTFTDSDPDHAGLLGHGTPYVLTVTIS